MIDLHYPPTTFVGKPVPKNAFYRHLEVNAKMKQHFVDDVVAIKWLYKLAPSTLNVAGWQGGSRDCGLFCAAEVAGLSG